jgi:hypothetical protein
VPAGLGAVTQVSAGRLHTCARKSDGTLACWGWNASGQTDVPAIPTTTVYPTATFSAAASVVAGQSFTLELNDAQVPGYTGPVSFTYAFDCGDGTGYGAFGASNSASCLTSAAGTRDVKGTVKDQEGDQTEYTATVEVTPAPSGFTFTGFFSPVDNLPAVNVMQAGRAVPIRFSLGGDHGLDIFYSDTPSWPRSAAYACDAAPGDPVDGTTTAGGSSLSYDPETDRYTYVWKTERSWGNSCRELTLKLSDGSEHRLRFRFPR